MKIITISSFVAAVIAVGATYFISTKPAVAQNEPLKIILPSGSTGSFNARFQIMKPLLEKEWGNKIELIYGKNCKLAKTLLDAEKGPALSIWMVFASAVEGCKVPFDHPSAAVELNGFRFCTSKASGLTAKDMLNKTKPYTIGVTDPFSVYVELFSDMNKQIGTKLKPVPYTSSGKARRGLLAGDVDFVLMSPSNSNKLMKSDGQCFYSTLKDGEPKWNLPAFRSVVDFDRASLAQGLYYPLFNMSDAQKEVVRKVFALVAAGEVEAFNKFAGGRDVFLKGTNELTPKQMVDVLNKNFRSWNK
jgi:hypothetical protein